MNKKLQKVWTHGDISALDNWSESVTFRLAKSGKLNLTSNQRCGQRQTDGRRLPA